MLEIAINCGLHLLSNQGKGVTDCKAWKTIGETPLTGFSHGSAGIALSLLRLYKATGDKRFFNAALEGIKFERKVFSPNKGNWPDFRNTRVVDGEKSYTCQWCHGATGIGLARLSGLDILGDREVYNELEIALKTTIDQSMKALDNTCCGNFGCIEFIFSAGLRLKRPELCDLAKNRTIQLLQRAKINNKFGWLSSTDSHNLGFFSGITGVGYQLLRLTNPDILSSVLMWE